MTKKTAKKKATKKKDRFMRMQTKRGGSRVVKDGKVVEDSKADNVTTEKDKTDVD